MTAHETEQKAAYREAARDAYGSDEVEIESSAPVSDSAEGAWVQAWVWVGAKSVAPDESTKPHDA